VGKNLVLCAGLAGAFGVSALTGTAQEAGTVFTLDVSQRLESTDNLSLSVPAEGTTTAATTRLSFGISSQTRTERFNLKMGTAFRIIDGPDGSDNGFDDPFVTLSYGREGANAELDASARYRRNEVDFLHAFDTVIGDDGSVELPDDFDDLIGSGTRESYGANARLDIGKNAPLGFGFSTGFSALNYSGVTDPDLFDSERQNYSATARLRFSNATTGHLTLRRDVFKDEDPAEQTERKTTSLSFGITHEASPRLTIDASLGHTKVDTDETIGIVTTRSSEDGINGNLDFTYDMPNGDLTAGIDAGTNQDGTRFGASLGRSLDLPDGYLSASLGLTRLEDSDTDVVASLNWQKELPNGNLNARLNRSVRSNNNDADVLTTTLFLGYSHNLSETSGLRFNLAYAETDEGGNDITQTSLSASYRRELTRDWDMNFGISHRERGETTVGSADSQSVFFALSRQFKWQR